MTNAISVDVLRKFIPFDGMSEDQLLILSGKLERKKIAFDSLLFNYGEVDSHEYFLLSGALELTAEDGRSRIIESGSDVARRAIARLRPRQYSARAHTSCEYISVDSDLLEALSESMADQNMEVSYGVADISDVPASEAEEVLASFHADLKANRVILNSLPEIAIKIRELIDSGDVNTSVVSKLVNRDPAIAAKLIKAANSPIYHGASNCDSINNAIVRLGLVTTRQLVVGFTLRDLFKTESKALRSHMEEIWQQSVSVAALSFVLAKHAGDFSPEEAMLAGLVSNVGAIVVLNYLPRFPNILKDPAAVKNIVSQLKSTVGGVMLSNWGFAKNVVEVAKSCEDWERCPSSKADLCDLVMMATLHSYIGKKLDPQPPLLDSVPAFTKLALGKLTPEKTLAILDEAKAEVDEARQLLVI